MWPVIVAAALLAAPPPTGEVLDPDALEDVSKIDKAPLTRREAERAKREAARERETPELERLVDQTVPSAEALTIARGDTVFVELDISLSALPSGELVGRLSNARRAAVRFLPWLRDPSLDLTPAPKKRSKRKRRRKRKKKPRAVVHARYGVRVDARSRTGSHQLASTLELIDLGTRRTVARIAVTHTIKVVEPQLGLTDIAQHERAFSLHQGRAKTTHEKLGKLRGRYRLDRVGEPLALSATKNDRDRVARFLDHRLGADIARERIRAAAYGKKPDVAEAAAFAIGRLTKEPTGAAAQARAIEDKSPEDAVRMARKRLEDLDLDEAEGLLSKIRKSGGLDHALLAQTLSMLGTTTAIRGRPDEAKKLYGQSSCLDPKLDTPKFGPAKKLFEQVRSEARCTTALRAGKVSAQLINTPLGDEVLVRVEFAPDPYGATSGGDIELFGAGGGVLMKRNVRARRDGEKSILEAQFPSSDAIFSYEGMLLVRAVAKDLSGVQLASLGVPDPRALELEEAEEYSTPGTPWWVWVLGGVAVAGAAGATAAVIVTQSEDVVGVGPIEATF